MHVYERHSVVELMRPGKREKRAAMVRRLQVVILARQGRTAPRIVEATGASRCTVQEWVQRYKAGSLA
jgi:transposase